MLKDSAIKYSKQKNGLALTVMEVMEEGVKTKFATHQRISNYLLVITQRRGMITYSRKGKDSTKIKNWRPVALLNTDYKILTKSLSRRLEKYIANVINPDQSGFVSGRYIGESIRFVEDIIEKFDREDNEGIILQ